MSSMQQKHLARGVRRRESMRNGIRFGRLFGIELKIDPSWLFILVLVSWSLASLFASWHRDWSPLTSFVVAVVAALAFFGSVLFHEMAHSLVAMAYGIPVRDITLHMFGGVSNIEREPPTPFSEFLMAIVGPIASIGLGVALMIAAAVTTDVFPPGAATPEEALATLDPVSTAILWLGPINVLVGVFNLVPGFPLDGGRILRSILWKITGNLVTATRWAAGAGQVVGWGFVATGASMTLGARVPFFGTGLMGGLWLVLIGLFLRNAAVQYHRSAALQGRLAGVRVGDVMRRQVSWVDAATPVRNLVEHGFLGHEARAFPVYRGSELAGIVSLDDLQKVPAEEWYRPVGELMTPRERLVYATPDEEVTLVMRRMGGLGVRQVPVLSASGLVGMLFESDIQRWLDLMATAGPAPTIRTRTA